jgi:hypothetical protein
MTQAYSDPSRESDPRALPDVLITVVGSTLTDGSKVFDVHVSHKADDVRIVFNARTESDAHTFAGTLQGLIQLHLNDTVAGF